MTYFLPRVVGPSKALELALNDPNLDANAALELGLVSEVVPADELLDRAREKAEKLAAKAPFYVRTAKALITSRSRTASPSTSSSSATGSPTAWAPRTSRAGSPRSSTGTSLNSRANSVSSAETSDRKEPTVKKAATIFVAAALAAFGVAACG